MYTTIEEASYVDLYYQLPCCDLDVGVVPIKEDEDIRMLLTGHRDLVEMPIYVKKKELALK